MSFVGGSEVCTYFELAAIFAALIAVTTLFSLVSLGTGAMGCGPAAGAYPVLIGGEPHIAQAGEITGFLSVPETSGILVDTLAFRIIHTGEGGAIDLSRVTVTVLAGDYLEILARSRETLPEPGMWSAAPLPDDDALFRPGDECTILLRLDRPAPADGGLIIKMRPEGSRPCTITGPVRLLDKE